MNLIQKMASSSSRNARDISSADDFDADKEAVFMNEFISSPMKHG